LVPFLVFLHLLEGEPEGGRQRLLRNFEGDSSGTNAVADLDIDRVRLLLGHTDHFHRFETAN
jgi:hypothetical protein